MPGQFLELTSPSPPPTCSSPCCSRRASPVRSIASTLPNPLLDLLSNSLILLNVAPHLPVSSVLALSSTNSRFHSLVFNSTESFRHLDLSCCKAANAAADISPIDVGGNAWRSERMDEALTEDEFYSGPLLGIFNRLASPRNNNILATVTTLILDGLTVPADLVREIIAEDRFHVRILSIRDAKHLNERKLRQMLRYSVRPGRPEGTPRLKGLYIFGHASPKRQLPAPSRAVRSLQHSTQTSWPSSSRGGVMHSPGAQLGAEWNAKSAAELERDAQGEKWYAGAGRVLTRAQRQPGDWAEWAELLEACEGIIAFDAVLCRGPRHDVSVAVPVGGPVSTPGAVMQGYLPPAIATVALKGCENCGSCPEEPAQFGHCSPSRLPLLFPVPLHVSTVRAAQIPAHLATINHESGEWEMPRFIARCEECLRGRWCERCNVWWDESCYAAPSAMSSGPRNTDSNSIKVHMGLCVQNCLVGDVLMSGMGEGGMWG